jgi:alkanesulfonate monooxygenase SsuD/methylene tetrahydromethanopterin reductase-like flavin-dependent oxidoreductase (luciferase family)
LAAFAARTQHVRLGTTSLLVSIHHPLRVADEVSALDALSHGRVWLGLGRGFREPLFRGFGVAAGRKRDRFDEAIDAILAAWSGEPLSLSGDFFDTQGHTVRAALRPLQRPHPPLLVAAFGRKGLTQAARRGLPYLASPLETLDLLAENHAFHRAQLASPLRDDVARAPVMRTVHVARDDLEAARVRAGLEAEARRLPPGRLPTALARAAEGPVAERVLVGTRSAVADGIARYRERVGMDLLIARSQVPGADEAAQQASLEALAELCGDVGFIVD